MKRFKSIFQVLMALLLVFGTLGVFVTSPTTVSAESFAQTTALSAGDIAVISLNADTKAMAFVTLVDLTEGTEIRFTDDGWLSTGGFRIGEGGIKYTVPTGGALAGSIHYTITPFTTPPWTVDNTDLGSGGFNLSTSGDQIIAFQGLATNPTFLYAVNDRLGTWQTTADTSNSSALPTGLVDGDTAVAPTEFDNIALNCTANHTGTKQQLLAFISDKTNWIGDNTTAYTVDPNCSFTISADKPKLNEFSTNTVSTTDVEFVEVFGSPNTDYSAYSVLEIEGDFNVTATGTVDQVISLGTTDANGIYLVNLASGDLENGTVTLLLVKDNTAILTNDIDTNDDGSIDATFWSEIADDVAIKDGGGTDISYSTTNLVSGYDGISFTPGGASRIPDGADTDTSADWVRNDFDLAGIPGNTGSIAVGEAYNTPGALNQVYVESAPYVVSTNPVAGGNHPLDGDITITFSEPVTVTEPWFTIICSSGLHTAGVTDIDPIFMINPDADFTLGESCTVTILNNSVVDDDTDDGPDAMLDAYIFTFTVVAPLEKCGDPFTPISSIQGDGFTTPILPDQIVSTEGIVVGDFQNNTSLDDGELNGFFIQDLTVNLSDTASDGIFAYFPASTVDVAVGDTVRVTGKVKEYNGLTEIDPVSQVLKCGTATSPDPITLSLPLSDPLILEQYEGMLVTFPQALTIAEYFNYDRFGNIVLSNGRFMNFTAANEPDVTNFTADNLNFKKNSIKLDDGISSQNPPALRHPDGTTFTKEHYFRGGDTVAGVTGVIDYYEDAYEANYRIQPTTTATYTPQTVGRQTIDDLDLVPGDLKVASFNVLNYFLTLNSRGANTTLELERQRDKLLAALIEINADIYGLMEIENDAGAATADLVSGLNDYFGSGTFAHIDTGIIGTDAIKQAILYKPGKVTPVGVYQILDSDVDTRFIDERNRPALAQTFTDNLSGKNFTVAVNHFKSKGSDCVGDIGLPDDPDLLDGQGNCNLTRKTAAEALVDWLADPLVFPDSQNNLIIGDLNSYDKEEPIDMIKLGSDDSDATMDDYLDLMFEIHGEYAYGYVFDGKIGYLDYALANKELAGNVVDVNFWHINADESDVFDYNTDFKPTEQIVLYSVDPYRSSDHDPVIVTLDLLSPVIVSGTAKSTADGDVIWTDGKFTVEQGYVVDTIEITMSEPVRVDIGTEVTMLDHGPYGTVTAHDGANITVTPYPGNGIAAEIGVFTFTVPANSVTDLVGNPFMGSIILDVLNVAPIAVDDTGTVAEDGTLTLAAPGVLANDTDFDPAILTAVWASDPSNGSLTFNTDGSFEYKPNANFNGTDTFTYKVKDGLVESTAATVTITVTPINDTPILAAIGSKSGDEDSLITFTASASDPDLADAPPQSLTFSLVGAPVGADINGSTGVFTWTPTDPGEYTFDVCVSDGALSYCEKITVTVNEVFINTAPVAVADAYDATEDTELVVAAPGVLSNDTDADGNTLTALLDGTTTNGVLTLNPDGSFSYMPNLGFVGQDTFTYHANDGLMGSNVVTVTITVTAKPVDTFTIFLPVIFR